MQELGRDLVNLHGAHYAILARSTGVGEIERLLRIPAGTWSRNLDVSVPGALGDLNFWSERAVRSMGIGDALWALLREAGIRCTLMEGGGMEVDLSDTLLSPRNPDDVRRVALLLGSIPRLGWRGPGAAR